MDITIYTAPIIGSLLGYYTNKLAVLMMFQPYNPWYINNFKVPFTPGLMPKNQEKIAAELIKTITTNLFTEKDFYQLSNTLVTEENVYTAVSQVIDTLLNELKNTTKLHNLATDVGEIISVIINKNIPTLTEKLIKADGEWTFLTKIIDNVFEVIIARWKISKHTADYITDKIMDTILSPESVRMALIKFLTPDNIDTISHLIKKKTRGSLGLVLTFMNTKGPLQQLKNFFSEEPELAYETIISTLESLRSHSIISDWILSFKPQDLTWATINYIKNRFITLLQEYLKEYHLHVILPVLQEINIPGIVYDIIVKFDVQTIPKDLIHKVKLEIARFIQRYLANELQNLVEKVLKRIDLDTLIIKKIKLFPSKNLEKIIAIVARKELEGIVVLGGIIGFLVGCLQILVSLMLA